MQKTKLKLDLGAIRVETLVAGPSQQAGGAIAAAEEPVSEVRWCSAVYTSCPDMCP